MKVNQTSKTSKQASPEHFFGQDITQKGLEESKKMICGMTVSVVPVCSLQVLKWNEVGVAAVIT